MKAKLALTFVTVEDDGAVRLFPGSNSFVYEQPDTPGSTTADTLPVPTGCTRARLTAIGSGFQVVASQPTGTNNPKNVTPAYESNCIFVADGDTVLMALAEGDYISKCAATVW